MYISLILKWDGCQDLVLQSFDPLFLASLGLQYLLLGLIYQLDFSHQHHLQLLSLSFFFISHSLPHHSTFFASVFNSAMTSSIS